MALVAQIRDLARAARPGTLIQLAVSALQEARAEPSRAGGALSRAQRRWRRLHSRDRRLLADGVFGVVRHGAAIQALIGSDADRDLWVGWLVKSGLPLSELTEPNIMAPVARWQESIDRLMAAQPDLARQIEVYAGVHQAAARQIGRAFPTAWRAFTDASNQRAPVTLRVNPRRGRARWLVDQLDHCDIKAQINPAAQGAVDLLDRVNLQRLDLSKSGAFEVQDAGSQLLAQLVRPTGLVVDYCAGAGGKTLAMAGPGVRLVACDVRERALTELTKRAKRAKVRVRVVQLPDDGECPQLSGIQADRVLVDAPCGGSGVLRRHPEHRWQLTDGRLNELVQLQAQILSRASALVAVGGELVYGTCSVLPRENEDQVQSFLATHANFEDTGLRLACTPHTHNTDGMFGAALRRVR